MNFDGEVLRLDLRPGDVIVFRASRDLTAEEAARIERHIRAKFAEHRCLVLGPGCELEIVRPTDDLSPVARVMSGL